MLKRKENYEYVKKEVLDKLQAIVNMIRNDQIQPLIQFNEKYFVENDEMNYLAWTEYVDECNNAASLHAMLVYMNSLRGK